MNEISEYKILNNVAEGRSLTEEEQSTLAHALQSDVMPIFRKGVFDDLIAQTAPINS